VSRASSRVSVGKMPTTRKAVNSTAGWQTVKLTQSLQVEAGDTIWLALYQNGSGLAWVFMPKVFESNPGTRYTSGSPSKAVSSQYWAGQMPQEFGSSNSSSYIYSICANYSPEQLPLFLLSPAPASVFDRRRGGGWQESRGASAIPTCLLSEATKSFDFPNAAKKGFFRSLTDFITHQYS
jgi:hypothetical protein